MGDDFVPNSPRGSRGYFAGEPVDFADVQLDLDGCTPFQLALVTRRSRRCRAARSSRTASWPRSPGRPGAARAAGTFCAQNRFGLFVPCHRVVAAAGLGCYGSLGVEYKRRLLELEGHVAL